MNTRPLRLLAALAVAALLGLPSAQAGKTSKADDPGRLLNLAQQLLARGEVDPAIATLNRVLQARPQEGFAWGLLAESLIWGKAEGAELVAAWEMWAERRPHDGHAKLRLVRARMALHRRDKFTSETTDWVISSEAEVRALMAASGPADLRYAATITMRDLLYRSGRPSEALAEGAAAWTMDKKPLQGRISRLQWSLQQGDLKGTADACRSILSTDPWAAEACAGLYSSNLWEASDEEVASERADVLGRIDALEEQGLNDLVLGNELAKFRKRAKNQEAERAWLTKLRSKDKGFRVADNPRWWRGTFMVPPNGARLFAATNRANNHDDAAERLSRLLALRADAPDDDGGQMVQRWRWRVAEAALAQEPPDTDEARKHLDRIVTLDGSDARAWMELAALSPPEQARTALLSAEQAVFRADWDPWERYGAVSFADVQARRSRFVADLRLRRAQAERELGNLSVAWQLALEASWAGPHLPDAWKLVAQLAADSGRADYARDADVSWLAARLRNNAKPASDDDGATAAIARYLTGHPDLSSDPSLAWPALLAAATARASVAEPTEQPTAPRETHPLIGEESPVLNAVSLSGGQRSLDELRGRVVVVDFWATWCAPCKRALPELQAAANELSDKPVTFLLVSVDTELDAAQDFIADSAYTMDPVWALNGKKTQKDWMVKGIPSTFVLDAEGVVRHHHQGYSRGGGEQILTEVNDLLR